MSFDMQKQPLKCQVSCELTVSERAKERETETETETERERERERESERNRSKQQVLDGCDMQCPNVRLCSVARRQMRGV